MEFTEDHLAIIETLTRIEARAFVKFLEMEVRRHQDDITMLKATILQVRQMHLWGAHHTGLDNQ